MEDEIDELETEIGKMETAQGKADAEADKRKSLYEAEKGDLKDTISGIEGAITALKEAGETDSGLLQEKAQDSVRAALAFLSMKATDAQQHMLMDFVSADPDAMGDKAKHVKRYKFKSNSVIGLLKELKLKFENDLTAADAAETKAENAFQLEKKARDNAKAAANKAKDQKDANLGDVKSDLNDAETNLDNEKADLKADTETRDTTDEDCKTRQDQWDERSKVRDGEIAAITEGIKILAKVSGVRTKAPSNPVPPASPVDFLQVEARDEQDPKAKAVNLLRQTAKEVHSKALERFALEISTHLTGPFDKVNDSVEKMIFRLMDEQAEEE